MVKLIASDIDGTLLSYGETSLPPALFGLIRRLRSAGVLFCPASGRQYHSMRQLFAPVADEVCFLCENGAAEALGPRWGEKFHMAEAGPIWLDFTLADKGTGLRGLCRSLGVDMAEVMAFGDNWNDVPMLEAAGTPWLMASAVPALRERFPRQCGGVLPELEKLLAELGA